MLFDGFFLVFFFFFKQKTAYEISACLVGMYLHGLAGDIAAERTGKESLIASDIIDSLPEAFKNLEK